MSITSKDSAPASTIQRVVFNTSDGTPYDTTALTPPLDTKCRNALKAIKGGVANHSFYKKTAGKKWDWDTNRTSTAQESQEAIDALVAYVPSNTSNAADPAKADPILKANIASQPSTSHKRTFDLMQDLAEKGRNDPNDPDHLQMIGFMDPTTNSNAKHNLAKIKTSSRSTAIKGVGDLWGHGENEPSGTRNLPTNYRQASGMVPNFAPESSFHGGGTFNSLHIPENIRTDTASVAFPDGTMHPGGLKQNASDKGFLAQGNANYDKAMDQAQLGANSPYSQARKVLKGHVNSTAKPNEILDPNGPFNNGVTVKGEDLSDPLDRSILAEDVGTSRNRHKRLVEALNSNIDMTYEDAILSPPLSPIDTGYGDLLPTSAQVTDPAEWGSYLNDY